MDSIKLPPMDSPGAGGQGPGAGRLLQNLWRGKWFFLVLPILSVGGMYLWLQKQVPLFRSSAQLLIEPREVNPLGGGGEVMNKSRTIMKQQIQLLGSRELFLQPLADSEELKGLRTFHPKRLGRKPVVAELSSNLGSMIDLNSDKLTIAYTTPFRQEAAKIVNAAVDQFLEYHRQKKRERAEEEAEIIWKELEKYEEKLRQTTEEILELKSESNLLVDGDNETYIQRLLDKTHEEWSNAQFDSISQSRTYRKLVEAKEDPERFLGYGKYWRRQRPLTSLENELARLESDRQGFETELADTIRRFGEDSKNQNIPKLRDKIEASKEREEAILIEYAEAYMADARVSAEEAEDLESTLKSTLDELNDEVMETNRILARLQDLEGQKTRTAEIVSTFKDRLTELGVENQAGALNMHLIASGRMPARAFWPVRETMLLYAFLGGLGAAAGIVLLRGMADRRLRDVEEIPATLGVSVLGVFPRLSKNQRGHVARTVEEHPGSVGAEAVRSVRTAATFALPENGKGLILVTSSVSGEGKSVSASNLAFAMAAAGRRTLLVDCDIRKAGQHEIYGVANEMGLGHLLFGSGSVKKAVVKNVASGLDLLPAGDSFGKAAELFESPRFVKLLEILRKHYDCVIFDSPPILETSEARVIAKHVDATIFVMRLEVSTLPNARRAASILASVEANLLGVFLNGARSKKGGAYAGGLSYGYGYGYGEGYGSSYEQRKEAAERARKEESSDPPLEKAG